MILLSPQKKKEIFVRAHVFQQHLRRSPATIWKPSSIRTAVSSLRALFVMCCQLLLPDPSFARAWVVCSRSGSSLMGFWRRLAWSDTLFSRPINLSWDIRGSCNSILRRCVMMGAISCRSVPLRTFFVLAITCTARVIIVNLLKHMTALLFRYFVFQFF